MSQQDKLSQLFGNEVESNKGPIQTASLLNKKAIGVYFSAHWCNPCLVFTTTLKQFYEKHSKDIEIIFLSSDNNPKQFKEYYQTMPWLAIPYEKRDKIQAISSLYSVRVIPTLVFISPDGQIITQDGRKLVTDAQNDPQLSMPWDNPNQLNHNNNNNNNLKYLLIPAGVIIIGFIIFQLNKK